MEPKIIEMNEIKTVGLVHAGECNNMEIPELWDRLFPRIKEIKNLSSRGLSLGICSCSGDDGKGFEYTACFEVDDYENVPEGMVTRTLPAHRYAVFTLKGKLYENGVNRVQELYGKIYNGYIPNSGLKLADSYDFECYGERFKGGDNAESEMDIYIPVE